MARENREIQNCTATCHESIADEYLEDIYESLSVSVDETDCADLALEDLIDIDRTRDLLIEISKAQLKGGDEEEDFMIQGNPMRSFIKEVSKTQMKGAADNGDFDVSDYG